MPLTSNASYLPAMDEFTAHWALADAALKPPLVLDLAGEKLGLADFTVLRGQLIDANVAVLTRLGEADALRVELVQQKALMLGWVGEFRALAEAGFAGTPHAAAVSKLVGATAFPECVKEMADLWGKLEAEPPRGGPALPLKLKDGTLLKDVRSALGIVETIQMAQQAGVMTLWPAKAERNKLRDRLREAMTHYCAAAAERLQAHAYLLNTIPTLAPADGRPPGSVAASAVFAEPDEAKVTHSAATEPSVSRYELRGHPGIAYGEDDAVTVTTHGPDEPPEFTTGFCLQQPGARVMLKVFTVLADGRESGSEAMVVERPL